MRTAVIHGNLPVDEHPDIVVTAEREFLAFVISECSMGFEAEMLIALFVSPEGAVQAPAFESGLAVIAPAPKVRVGKFTTISKQALAILDAIGTRRRPARGLAVVVQIHAKGLPGIVRHRAGSFALLSSGKERTSHYLGPVNQKFDNAIITRLLQRREPARQAVRNHGVGIESPTGIGSVMAERHIVTLDFVLALYIIKQRLEIGLGHIGTTEA